MTVGLDVDENADRQGRAEPLDGNYFVACYPPFSCWTEAQLGQVRAVLDASNGSPRHTALGLYVHIPFCAKRCRYCYYVAYAERPAAEIDGYIDAVLAEAARYADAPFLAGRRPLFVYFGGGTPSLLTPEQLRRLTRGLQGAFSWTDAQEVTCECAPQTVTSEKLDVLRAAGVTRLSLGVQHLDDAVLAQSGRVHLVQDVERAYAAVRRAGFSIVNLDLIVGLPGETDATLRRTIERVVTMQPESVTLYPLEIPHNTPLFHALRNRELDAAPASWDGKRARLAWAFARLEQAGYTVRSANAAVRDPQAHRFVYQDAQYHGADLLGLGVASFSYLGGVHFQNFCRLDDYRAAVADARHPQMRAYALGDAERLVRELILQLKLGRVDLRAMGAKFDVDVAERFAEPLARLTQAGWLAGNDETIRLTRDGLLRADRLLPEFYLPQHRGVRYW